MSATTSSGSASSGISTSSSLGVWVMPIRTSTWSHSPHELSDGSEGTSTLLRPGRLLSMDGPPTAPKTERSARWAATMAGYSGPVRLAHADSHARVGPAPGPLPADQARPQGQPVQPGQLEVPRAREERRELEDALLAPGATRSSDAGD